MTPLTSKQKSHLRSRGQTLDARASVGKAGLSEAFLESVNELLNLEELIKIRLPAGPGTWRRALAEEIAQALEAGCAGVVGRTALLYRPNPELPGKDRIHLPTAP